MTPAERATTLRRHELLRVVASLQAGQGWRPVTTSAYLAQAFYTYSDVIGWVVGNDDGWWWGLCESPRRSGPGTRADGPREACLAARQAVRSIIGKRGAMRT